MFIIFQLFASVALADFQADGEQVVQIASGLSSLVQAWQSPQGLEGALSIQQRFPSFVQAVNKLDGDVDQLSIDQLSPDSINTLSSSIVGLLGALTQKSSDFQSVGAQEVVGQDIRSMQQPAEHLVSGIVSVVTNSAQASVAAYTPALSSFSSAFVDADSAYGLPAPNFPTIGSVNQAPSGGSGSAGAPGASPETPSGSPPGALASGSSSVGGSMGGAYGSLPQAGAPPNPAAGNMPPMPMAPGGNYSVVPQANGETKLAVGIIVAAAAVITLLV